MSGMDLFREIGMIDEKYIIEAEETKRSVMASPVWRRSLATAACLCLCVGLYFSVQRLGTFSNDSATSESMKMETAGMEEAYEEKMEAYDLETASESAVTAEGSEEVQMQTNQEVAESVRTESEYGTDNIKEEAITQGNFDAASSSVRDLTDICARFAGYPDTPAALADAGLVVNLHGTIKGGREKLDTFLSSVEAGTPASVELVQYTVEGDAMFYYIDYNGTDFYAVIDYSRDEFAGSGEKVHEYRYNYLKVQEESIEGGKRVEILLTDTEELSSEKDGGSKYEGLCIMSYTE